MFALEHGLDEQETTRLAELLHESLRRSRASRDCWLAWVVYSAERGYDYLGDEYWPSFESRTPGWDNDDRPKVKRWFLEFHRRFGGVRPSGRWAECFTIISWPITHAVLPRYLQRHFAKALYDARHALFASDSSEPTDIGRLLAAHSGHGSERFLRFLEQDEMVGRIALAVLNGETAAGDLLYPKTFQRIVDDLERVQESREWLQEAKYRVGDRFRGIAGGTFGRTPRTAWRRREEESRLPSLRPRLMLRHRAGGTWIAAMEWPAFSDIARRSREHHQFLMETRCSLQGVHSPRPGGWLLTGRRIAVLRSYPDANAPLVRFERPHAAIEHLVNAECRLGEPPWLFRIGPDGTAHEIRGGVVRPGYQYILVARTGVPLPIEWADECLIECDGIHAIRLTVPDQVAGVWAQRLEQLSLKAAGTIRVWPAAIPGRNWDGEGTSEWLTTEAPCIGLVSDYPVESYEISVNGTTEVIPGPEDPSEATFVRLEPLPTGEHLLTVQAKRESHPQQSLLSAPARGWLSLCVRLPEVWEGGLLGHSGLSIVCEPANATLDQFWSNELDLTVRGPAQRQVQTRCSLLSRNGKRILSRNVGRPTTLPISPARWRDKFRQFAASQQHLFSEAASGRMTVDGGELGEAFIDFKRELLPLRWDACAGPKNTLLRLVDDSGRTGPPETYFQSIESPLKMQPLATDKATAGFEVTAPGGLFRARKAGHSDAVVVGATGTVHSFSDLRARPSFQEFKRGTVSLAAAIRLLSSWHDARTLGPLAQARRREVTKQLTRAIYSRIYGSSWANAASRFAEEGSPENLDRLQSGLGSDSAAFVAAICEGYGARASDPVNGPEHYFAIAREHRVSDDQRKCEIAWALATEPHSLERLFGEEADDDGEMENSAPPLGSTWCQTLRAHPMWTRRLTEIARDHASPTHRQGLIR